MLRTGPVRRAGWVLGALGALGCGAGTSSTESNAAPVTSECAVRLAPRQASGESQGEKPALRVAKESQIVVHAESSLDALKQKLEQRVQQRLAEGRFRIGPGGTVSYDVQRGALWLSVTATALVIETPVSAHAQACRGSNCYASCQPQAVVRATVPLLLRPDYRFEPSSISLRFTQGCKVRALGGFLTIDLTPTLEAELQPELAKLSRRIDEQLPDLRAEVAKAWTELTLPRPLPLGGCLLLQPRAIVQGALTPSAKTLRASFAVLATPELRTSCNDVAEPQALPALQRDLALPEEGAVRLGLVTPLAGFERSFLAANPVHASQRNLRITGARVAARGSDVDVALELEGDICGSTSFAAVPEFSGEGQLITLGKATLDARERQRWQASQADGPAVVSALVASSSVAPLLSVPALRSVAPSLAQALSQPSLRVSAQVSSARAAGAAARGDQLVAWVEARGSITLEQK